MHCFLLTEATEQDGGTEHFVILISCFMEKQRVTKINECKVIITFTICNNNKDKMFFVLYLLKSDINCDVVLYRIVLAGKK